MLIETMTTSLAVGKIRGGKIKNLEKANIKAWYLFIIGFGLEFISVILRIKQVNVISDFLDKYFMYIHGISYILILIGLILNFRNKSMVFIFMGTVLNFIVIMANGGRMPVSGDGLNSLGLFKELEMLKAQSVLTHTLVTEATKLSVLGDVIPIPRPYPFPKMISIGDIFIALGVFLFIQSSMVGKNIFNRKINTIKFQYKGK